MKGWKTIAFNVGSLLLLVLNSPELLNIVPGGEKIFGYIVVVINMVLRMVTTGPVGKKD